MKTERLPLFPLNTVLIPGTVLPLHIFEPRYQIMLYRVLAGDQRFGVVLIHDGRPDISPAARTVEVGTVAEVTAVVPLDDGRSNISTTGRQRFRVTRLYHDQPYLTGDVELLSDDYAPSERLRALFDEVRHVSRRYVIMLLALSHEQVAHIRLPDEPVTLSYKVAGLLEHVLQPAERQRLLEAPGVEHRLYAELLVLRRELAILRRMGEMGAPGDKMSPN